MSLVLQDVGYSFGRGDVLRQLTVTFDVGATVLLGPNGAGKSTLLEIIASVRKADRGTISLEPLGEIAYQRGQLRQWREAVAWLPQQIEVFPGLRTREHVAYSGWLKGMSRSDAWVASRRALERVNLFDKAEHLARQLSGGQQKRLGIAGALVHDARVVLLDEPTAGLDPIQRRTFRELLPRIAEDRIVLVSSHDTDDAHGAFDSAAVIRDGELLYHGILSDFVSLAESSVVTDVRDRMELAYLLLVGGES